MTQLAAVPLKQLFRSEIAAARALGFQLQVSVDEGIAAVRLHPDTDRARALCAANDAGALDATAPVDEPAHALDALKLAIDAAIDMARQAYV